uniref:Thioredoxin domain n=2 Tax=unclassified Seunavirus TaxID=2494210 RepID=A0AAU8GGP2_9CAUD
MSIKNNTFIIYGKDNCPHCVRAKEFAKAKGLEFMYMTLDKNYTKEELVAKCAPVIPTTVPRIFMEDDVSTRYIGTADEFIDFVRKNA